MKKNSVRFIYAGIYIVTSFLFLKIIYSQISKTFFEHDLLYHLPGIARHMEKLSGIRLIGYVLDPFTMLNLAPIKIQVVSVMALFGPSALGFTLASIIFHFFNSFLVYCVSRKFELEFRISFLAGLMYLALFAHFHAYKDPLAFQHLSSVFFILLGLNFYLKTDSMINGSDKSWFGAYLLTLAINLAASFCIMSVALLPAMIITHILFCAKDSKERLHKYNIWLPLFIVYLIYPLLTLVFGHDRFSKMLTPIINKSAVLGTIVRALNIPARFLTLFLIGVSGLLIFRQMLAASLQYGLSRFFKKSLIILSAAAAAFLLIAGGIRKLLIPYNCLMPFAGMLACYLSPIQHALLINSTHIWHYIPFQINVFYFLISAAVLAVFIKNFLSRHKQLLILAIWYFGNMFWLYGYNPILSRYLVYLSPVFCIIFAAGFVYLYTQLTKGLKVRRALNDIILVLVFAILCIPNLFAINLALFRGRLVNTFCVYDYARAAEIVKYDLIKTGQIDELKSKKLHIGNIVPVNLDPRPGIPYFGRDPHNDIARFTFMHVFNDTSMDVALNQVARPSDRAIVYTLDGYRIYNAYGVNIDPFWQFFEQGIKNLQSGRHTDALSSFKKALAVRPYLFNYILSGLRLDDLFWITHGDGMRAWAEKVKQGNYIKDKLKVDYTAAIIDKETDDLIQCLFYISFLEYSKGHSKESEYWFSQIRFLDADYERLRSWLSQIPLVKSDRKISDFLNNQSAAALYESPENYCDRYKFEKFLFRLIFKA